jgi:hypothetical protein
MPISVPFGKGASISMECSPDAPSKCLPSFQVTKAEYAMCNPFVE